MRAFQDVRFALRLLAARPGFAVVAILTLALGVGAATSIFTVVEAVLLRPLPFAEPDRLVHLQIRGSDGELYPLPDSDVIAWRDQSESFSSVAAYDSGEGLALTEAGEPEQIVAVDVTDRFFAVLGVVPLVGRTFDAGADRPGAAMAVVLSYAFWQRRYRGDATIVGRSILLDGTNHTIVGVMPPTFAFPWADLDVWRVLTLRPPLRRGPFYTRGIARLQPGASLSRGQENLAAIADRIKRQYPGPNDWSYSLVPLQERMVGDVRRILNLLFAAVGFLLLIATANVANLLLARAGSRSREMAVRAAIGAGRGRIIRQLMTESLLLGVIAALVGLLFAAWGTHVLLAMAPDGIPRLGEVRLNRAVFTFAVGVSSLCSFLFGCAPALRASRASLVDALKEGGRTGIGARQRRTQRVLVVAEIALALILSVSAGLMIRSFAALSRVDPGFQPTALVTFHLSLPEIRYDTPQKIAALYDALRAGLEREPAIRSVGYSVSLPPDVLSMTDNFVADGAIVPRNQSAPIGPLVFVDENYFLRLAFVSSRDDSSTSATRPGNPTS